MKNIILQRMELINFKGIKSLEINFENQTDIFGANGTGKTTVFDAFTFLLFGKDSSDRKDFEVKTLDKFGKAIPKIEHEVNAVIVVDGEDVSIRRILKENWVKKRGSLEAEFSGNITDLYWNDVQASLTEFNAKVNSVLNEQVFKMITSPTYFNSIDWKQRRGILTQIAGEISDTGLAAGNPEYEALIANLTQGKTLEDYKSQILASIKKAKEDLKAIPTRIDEVTRSKPEAQDFRILEIELEGYQKQLEKVDEQLADANKAFQSKLDSQKGVKISINNLEGDISNIENNARREVKDKLKPDTSVLDKLNSSKTEKENELTSYQNGVKTLEEKKAGLENQIKTLVSNIEGKRAEWNAENAKELTFNDNDFHCPTCKREFEAGDVEGKKAEMLTTFKNNKAKKLNETTQQGQSFAAEKTNLENEVSGLITRIDNGKKTIESVSAELEKIKADIQSQTNTSSQELPSEDLVYESILSSNPDYKSKKSELEALKSKVEEIPSVDNSRLTEQRKSIVSELDSIKAKLQSKTQIEAADKRISELGDEERTLAQQIANVEKTQFTIENFIKYKIDRLEADINGKFKMVSFKMFEEQINGGLRETCEAMVNGVPYSDINTASKINAGIDIINTLCEFYGVTAPIFIDNRESVTNIINTESQIISLIVSETHTKLCVKSKELAA